MLFIKQQFELCPQKQQQCYHLETCQKCKHQVPSKLCVSPCVCVCGGLLYS